MRDHLIEFVGIIRKDPAVDHIIAFTGSNGGGTNTARMFITLAPRDQRKISADLVIGRLRKEVSRISGAQSLPAGLAGFAHRRPLRKRAVSVHLAERRSGSAQPVGAADAGQDAVDSADYRRQQRSEQQRPRCRARDRSENRFAARDHAATDRRYLVRRVRAAAGIHDVYPVESVSRRDGGRAAILAEPRHPARHLCAHHRRRRGSAERVHPLPALDHAAGGESSGAVPGGDHLVQSGAGGCARRRRDNNFRRRQTDRPAGRNPRHLSGHGAGLSVFAGERADADPGRSARRSTSCWEFYTKVTSIRSRSSRPCRRPGSERCWP